MALRWVSTLPEADRCQSCGTSLRPGLPAWWDDETRQVWCSGCRPAPATTPAPGPAAGPDERLQEFWARLVRYLRRTVEAEAAGACTLLAGSRWAPMPPGEEPVLGGGADRVPLHPALDRLAGRLLSGQALFYGWPAVVLRSPDGPVVAPLFAARLAAPPYSSRSVPLREEPALNPALVCETWFDPQAVAAARAEVGDRLPLGEPGRMAGLAGRVAGLLGLEGAVLDPERLRPDPPRLPGLHNGAVVVLGESAPRLRDLVAELRELERRDDWSRTAAAWLLGLALPDLSGREGDPVVPLPMDPVLEEAARGLRQAALSVVLGPPGTGKTRLAVAALAQAWLDGDSVLLSAPEGEALDEVASRARELHPGLVLRVGSREAREGLPRTLASLLARSRSGPGEAVALRELERAGEGLRGVLGTLGRRARLEAELAEATREHEEAARRAWRDGSPPPGVDPEREGRRAGELSRVRFLAGLRRRWYLRRLGAWPAATLDDVGAWARTVRRVDELSRELADLGPDGPGALEEAEASRVRAGAAAVAACIEARLEACREPLEALGRTRSAGPLPLPLPGLGGQACPSLELKAGIPLQAGLFDLGILDEAGRCTLAAALPLAYRARRLALLGDPCQPGPGTRLDEVRLRLLAEEAGFSRDDLEVAGLDPARGSAFHAFASRGGFPAFLEGQFRCHPRIAGWLSARSYGGSLVLLPDPSSLGPGRAGLDWVDVRGSCEPAADGGWVNRAEARALLEVLEVELASGATVGVLTPMAAQARLLLEAAGRAFAPEVLAAASFAVGAGSRLPGGPRDVLLLSSVVDAGCGADPARWVEGDGRWWNQALGQACRSAVVFGDPGAAARPDLPTLGSLRASALGEAGSGKTEPPAPSESERRLGEALIQAGLRPAWRVEVDGFAMDFVVGDLDLEVVGGVVPTDLELRRRGVRDRAVEALGYRVVRLPAWRCLREPQALALEVHELLARGR